MCDICKCVWCVVWVVCVSGGGVWCMWVGGVCGACVVYVSVWCVLCEYVVCDICVCGVWCGWCV